MFLGGGRTSEQAMWDGVVTESRFGQGRECV